MKEYTDFRDPAFLWMVSPTKATTTSCVVFKADKMLFAVIPEDEATERDIEAGTKEDWYVMVFPVLLPRGWFESEMETDDTACSYHDTVVISPEFSYRTSRLFVNSKALFLKATRILTTMNDQIQGTHKPPEKVTIAKAPGNQYDIPDQIKLSTARLDEIDGNNPLPVSDAFKRNFDKEFDFNAKIDLQDHASPDFQTWLKEQRK